MVDVNLDKHTIRIARGVHRAKSNLTSLPTKTRRSNRTIPLPDLCVRASRGAVTCNNCAKTKA